MVEVLVSPKGQGYASSSWKWLVWPLMVVQRRRRTAITRKAIAGLEPNQLEDIGYPEPPRAIVEVKPGLIANLKSMI